MATNRAPIAKTIVSRLLLFSGSIFLFSFSTIAIAGTPLVEAASPQQQNQPMASSDSVSPLSPADQSDQTAALTIPDKDFVSRTHQNGMAEIQLGQLAVQKSSSEDVKEFSRKMMDDHETIVDHMEWAAQHMSMRMPSGISKKNKELIAKLQGLSGAEFDNAYIVAMVKDHKNDEGEFREEARQCRNPNLLRLVQQESPLIEQQLQTIEQIAQTHHLMNEKGKLIAAGQ